jgi:hypothetical protein
MRELINLYFAGTMTSNITNVNLMHFLLQKPAIYSKLMKEITSVFDLSQKQKSIAD